MIYLISFIILWTSTKEITNAPWSWYYCSKIFWFHCQWIIHPLICHTMCNHSLANRHSHWAAAWRLKWHRLIPVSGIFLVRYPNYYRPHAKWPSRVRLNLLQVHKLEWYSLTSFILSSSGTWLVRGESYSIFLLSLLLLYLCGNPHKLHSVDW